MNKANTDFPGLIAQEHAVSNQQTMTGIVNTETLLQQLRQAGIRIALGDNNKLKIRAPEGALTAHLKQQLKQKKDDIILLLKNAAQQPNQASNSEIASDAISTDKIPLSFTQERLWFLEQLADNNSSSLYNMPGLFRLNGIVSTDKLQQAFTIIVQRHEVLRTQFITEQGKGFAKILPQGQWQLEEHDFCQYSQAETRAKSQKIIQQQLSRGFSLSSDCLLRTVLIQESDNSSVLVLTMHHIISDGWSVQVLIREFISIYTALVQDLPLQLSKLPIQYADYAHWQRDHLQGETLESSLQYWRKQLHEVPLLELPGDFQRPAIQSTQGAILNFSLDAQLIEQLNNLSKQQGVTLFMVLLAGLSLLLSRYSQQDDICIGSPVANRNRRELHDLIGFFANTLVFRQQLIPGQSINEFLQIIKKNTIDAYEHQETPFEKIVDDLKIERSLSHSPLFQVMLVLQNIAQERIQLPGMDIEPLSFDSGNAKFDLTFTIEEAQSRTNNKPVAMSIEYNTALFKAQTIEKMAQHFIHVLQSMAQSTAQDVAAIEFLSQSEKQQQLIDWQRAAVEHQSFFSVQQMFETQVARQPDAVAVIYGAQQLSYAQLNAQANQLAHLLQSKGIGRGQSVGICLPRSLEMIVSLYGVLKSGAAYIPMDINYPRERLNYMLSETLAPLLITDSERQKALDIAAGQVFLVDQQWQEIKDYGSNNPDTIDQRNDPLYTIFTSGSTGQPKGVQVRHSGELNLLPWYCADFAMTEQDKVLLMSAFGFDLTQKNLFAPLVCGAALVIPEIDHYDHSYLLGLIKQHRISWLNCAPSAFYPLIEAPGHWQDIASLRYVFLGGEAINLQKILPWEAQTQCRLVNSYGPTECTDIAAYHILDSTALHDSNAKSIPIGKANHNVTLYILNEQHQLIPEGHIGELYIGGKGIGLGYINQSELTAEKFIKNPFDSHNDSLLYQTGDLVRYQADGVIEYIGRTDFQVKLRGLRIELGEIEYHLGQLENIKNSAVRIVADQNGLEHLLAYIVSDNTQKNTKNKGFDSVLWRAALLDKLPEYMVPHHYMELECLPLTANGKVDNKALPALEIASVEENYQPPRTAEEHLLCNIWSDFLLLKTDEEQLTASEKIGIEDNFFALGGDSILSIQIISRANEQGLNLQARDIFQYQTIAQLAQHALNNAGKKALKIQTEQGCLTGSIPLSPVQKRFFQKNFNNKDHWNQSVLLSVSRTLDIEILEQVLQQLVVQHDVLHSRFSQNAQHEWQQFYTEIENNAALITVEQISFSNDLELNNIADRYQASLSIKQGRLLQAVLFENTDAHSASDDNRLLIIIHHLVVDGISWRVLFADMQQLCLSLVESMTMTLPAKRSSYRQWTRSLAEYATSETLLKQLPFWQAQAKKVIEPLPVDNIAETSLVCDSLSLHLELPESQTRALLSAVNQAYNTEINDILLTGLLQAMNNWGGMTQLAIALEGHGRETLSKNVDISAAAGWFTSVFPVFLQMDSIGAADIATLIKSVKEQLRQIPEKGVGYGILRYLHPEQQLRSSLQCEPQIAFNYLGQSDNVFSDSDLFALASEASGNKIAPANENPFLLELNCVVVNGSLRFDWTYSGRHFKTSSIERLAQCYLESLQQLIHHCLQPDNSAYTPSDFPLTQVSEDNRLTQTALDSLCELVANDETLDDDVRIDDIYPLSPMQKGMLFHSAYTQKKQEPLYIEQLLLSFDGELDHDIFQQSWKNVIARHSILRSRFIYQQGLEPLQMVTSQVKCQIQSIDFIGWDELHLQDFLKAVRQGGFKLDEAPLMRWHLLKLEDKNLFVWTFHHLLADGWSTALILREVLHNYQTLLVGKQSLNSHASLQNDNYNDFIQYLLQQDKPQEEQFWQKYLTASDAIVQDAADKQFATELPLTTVHFDAADMGDINKFKHQISIQQTDKLNDFAQQYHLTVNTLMQGLWGLLLGKYSHSEQVQFGIVVSGRPTEIAGIDNKVGLFINSLPVRMAIDPQMPVHQWFFKLQQQQVEHQQYHHSALNDIQHWTGLNTSELFNHIFVFENYPVDAALQGDDLPIDVLELEMVEKTSFPLTVSVTLNKHLAIEFAYDNTVYTDAMITQIAGQLDYLINSVLQTPDSRLADLSWLSEKAKAHLINDLNQTNNAYNKSVCLHRSFEQQVESYPQSLAVVDVDDTQLSYQQLNEQANQLAHYLLAQGVTKQSIIAVCMTRSSAMLISLLAVLKTGCAYVPMDPQYPQERLTFILQDTQTEFLLTQSDIAGQLPGSSASIICVDETELYAEYPVDNLNIDVSSDALAYIIYTSGSTGQPKGVMVRHRNVQNLCQWHQGAFLVDHHARATQIANIAFDAAAWEIWPYLLCGASLYLLDQQTILAGKALLDYYVQQRITHSFVPTPVAESLLQLSWPDNTSLQYLLTGGDRLSNFVAGQFAFQLVNNYGPTEATVVTTSLILSKTEALPPIGRPVSNTRLYVVDSELNLLPKGVVGELLIAGDSVAKGYLNRPELSAQKFISDPFIEHAHDGANIVYRSGDLVRYQADGCLQFIGRTDDQVKIRGYRIELGEISSLINRIDGVLEATVVVKADQQKNRRIVAYWSGEETMDEQQIRQLLKRDLPDYMLPACYVKMPSLPLTAHGKINTRALPEIEFEVATAYQEAGTEAERLLLQIWMAVLKKEKIGIHDNFFELGGDSILSIQLISRASDAGYTLQPRDVFQYQTIAELAQYAQQQSREIATEQGILSGDFSLSPIQSWFFKQDFSNINHWNQSVLLNVDAQLDASLLKQAFYQLLQQHDVLHLNFRNSHAVDVTQIQQYYQPDIRDNYFFIEDLSQTSDDLILELSLEIKSRANKHQSQLKIHSGELFRVVLFLTDEPQDNKLLIIAHHLIIDGVSWRILLTDLQQLCQQLQSHQLLDSHQLPEMAQKGSSFRQWQTALADYAVSEVSAQQLKYWQQLVKRINSADSLTVDRQSDVVITRDRRRVTEKLSSKKTQQLLQQVNNTYNTEVNDILLCAMLLALHDCRELQTLSLMLEGHGREAIAENLDVSRTVGWFTSMYPVLLSLPENIQAENELLLAQTIKQLKEQLRNIPDNGIAYSALRYLHPQQSIRESLQVQAEVSFNYLGQTDNLFADTQYFNFAGESSGDAVAADNQHPHLLDLSAIVLAGQLEISWVYSTRHFNEDSIDELSSAYLQRLEQLIEHCLLPENKAFTPSDFPLLESFEQQMLDEITASVPAMVDLYPLSPLQEGMLFHSLYQQSEEVYIEQMQMTLKGDLNIDSFQQAWAMLIHQHTILRTGFYALKGLVPLQIVLDNALCPVNISDASHWTEAQCQTFFAQDRRQGFDLQQPPLMRLNLLQHNSEHYTFVWTCHHILADGWSFPLIIQEVMENYEDLNSNNMPHSQQYAVDEYKHFIHYLQQQDKESDANYWKNYLQDASAAALPLAAHHYDSKNTARNEFLSLQLSQSKTSALNALTQQYHITMNTLIQGLWAILLSKYSGEQAIVFGMTVSGRPAEISGVEKKVGLYINSLPVKIQVIPEMLVSEWFFALQQEQNEHQKYHHSGLNDIHNWTGIAAEQLFNQLFVFENYPVSDAISENKLSVAISDVKLIEKTNYPLTITTSVTECLKVEFGFNTQVYPDNNIIETIAEHFDILLNSLLEQTDNTAQQALINDLQWLSADEQHKLTIAWNQTSHAYNEQSCLHQMIEQHAEQTPDAPAVIYLQQSLNYAQLNQRANQLAHYLIAQDISKGDFVGLCFTRHSDLVVAMVAVLKAGAAYIPMDPDYPKNRLQHIIEDSQTRLLLSQQSLENKLMDFNCDIFCMDVSSEVLQLQHDNNPELKSAADQPAYMIYTSGSTGLPKGVLCHHRGVMNLLGHFHRLQPFSAGEQHSLWTSISFDVSVYEIFSALTSGGTIHLLPESIRSDAQAVFAYLSEKQINSSYLPPFFLSEYKQWLSEHPHQSVLKRLLVGVEPIAEQLLVTIQNKVPGLQIINGYGPTEATICSSLYAVHSQQSSGLINTPIGKPVDNCQIYLLDQWGKPVPAGVNGEICIAGHGITHGYWNNPQLSNEKFITNPYTDNPVTEDKNTVNSSLYKTGDLGRYLEDGNIEFVGRNDTQIKLRGYRIELSEIESQLRALPEINESVVLLQSREVDNNQPQDKQLLAYVTLNHQINDFDQELLKITLSDYLPDYMMPAVIIALVEFPLSPNGKIDKKALPEAEFQCIEYIAPETPIQIILVDIWSDILHKAVSETLNIGIKDNFFAIGGHSLLATQVITHINKHYALDLPVKALFDAPTIEQLSRLVSETETQEQSQIHPAVIMPALDHSHIPLSFAQERLWFVEQFSAQAETQKDHVYSIPALLKFSGDLKVQQMQAALATMVQRHSILSTRFVSCEGEAFQEIQQPSQWHLEYDDYACAADLSEVDPEIAVQQRIQAELEKGFDLTQGNLFRTLLLKTAEQEHLLLIIMHHIISDGWSMSVLLEEFSKLYSGITEQADNDHQAVQLLPALPVQYSDFAVWQRKWLTGDRLEQQLSYWKQQLDGVPVLELATDYPRPSVQSFQGREYTFTIDKDITKGLNDLSIQQDATLFMTLLSGFSILLHKYSGQNDICIGSPIANRNRKEIESLIGFFVNTLALRQQVEPQDSFNDLLQQVRRQTLDAYEHQDVPFEKIIEHLTVERNLSYSPLFQVMLVLQNTPMSLPKLPGVALEEIKVENTTAKFDLTFTCVESEHGLRTTIEYRSELFMPETIERMAGHFNNILSSLVSSARSLETIKIAQIDILCAMEKDQQLVNWQQPLVAHTPYLSIAAMFEAQAVRTPDAIAIRYAQQSLSYAQLNKQANQLAHYLRQRGIASGQSVGICLSRSLEMMISLYGVIKAGASYIPMDINYPEERLRYMLDETASPLIITHSDIQEKLHISEEQVFLVDRQWSVLESCSGENLPEQDLREQPLYTIFTSGSTGQPKGARVKHSGELNLLPWYIDDFNMSAADNILLMSAFGFDLTQKNLFAPLMCGATLVIPEIEHYDNHYLLKLIQDEKISWLNCAPSAFYPLIEESEKWLSMNSLRYVFLGGEPISVHKVRAWQQQSSCQLVNSYGPTECTDIASYHVLDELSADDNKTIPIGKANHNVQLFILNKELQLIPEGNIGELYIAGAGVGLGYINHPELNADSFISSPFASDSAAELIYKTGDLVRYQKNGVIEYIGRADSQVKLRGLRIELGEIEYQLAQNAVLSDVAVRIVTDSNHIEQLVAYIVCSTKVDLHQLRTQLAQHLPDYMLPNFFIELEALPLTPNGKIDNKALPDLTHVQAEDNYQVPETPVQLQVAEIWSDILGVSPVGCSDQFFNLGGNSLIALKVLSRINAVFALNLSVKSLFEQPVLKQFSEIIEQQLDVGKQQQTVIEVTERPDVLPLSYAQKRLWFIEQMHPEDATYNISSALRINGQLDPYIVEKVFRQLIQRHESLRTNFLNDKGQAVQFVHDADKPEFKHWLLPFIDLTQSQSAEHEARQRAEADARTPFKLVDEPLFRVQLLKLADEQYILLFAMHHIISDGWSMTILQRDFSHYYQSYTMSESLNLPDLTLQYADFALWQERFMDQQYIEQQLDFWKDYLRDIPALLRLPLDYPRPVIATQHGAHYQFKLDIAVFRQIKAQAKEQQVSLFMYLLSAWQILLSRYSEQQDICVGIPVSGREQEEIKDLIGFFVNVIVIRSDLSLNPDFNELLAQTKQSTLNAFEHQAVPAEMVIDAVQPVRDTSHAPIAQVGFSYTDAADMESQISGLHVEAIDVETHSAKYDITLSLSDSLNSANNRSDLFCELEFNTDLFKQSTIVRMADDFISVLNAVVQEPERPVATINMIKTEELYTLLGCSEEDFSSIEPLASTQKDIYLQTLMSDENSLHNCMGYLTESNGDFNPQLWYQALELLYQYESGLRTEFRACNAPLADMAYQCILKHRTPNYQYLDFSSYSVAEARKLAEQSIKQHTYKHYQLNQTDLLSHYVFKIAEQQYYVAAAFHHILLDGVGGYMLWKKLTAIYNALQQDNFANDYQHPQPLFLNYVHEHNQAMDRQHVLSFWQQQAANTEPLSFTLPAGQSETIEQNVVQKTLRIEKQQWLEIRQFCRKQRTTPALYFKAIYGLLLRSYCRAEKSFAIGDYIGSRKKQHMYALGCYFEQAPFIFDLDAMCGGLADYLQSIKQQQKQVNQNLPLSLAQQNKIFASSVFRASYNFYAWPYADEFLGNMQRGVTYAPEVAETQLQFIVKAMADDATLILDYTTNTFAENDFLQQVKVISDQFIAGHTQLNELQWLNKQAITQQLTDWQSESIELEYTAVHQMFEAQVVKTPDNIALRWAGQSMTFSLLNEKANQLAHFLQQQGVVRGSQVGICLGRSFDMIIAVLAVIKTGAGYVPMDISYPQERLKFTLNEIDACMLITDSSMQSKLLFNKEKTFLVDQHEHELESFSHENLHVSIAADDPFYTIFTSGSTGRPKGAAVSHRCEINMLNWYTETTYQMCEQDNVLIMSAFGFDLTQKNIFAPLTSGATLVLPQSNDYDPLNFCQLIAAEQVTWTSCTPSAFFPLIEDAQQWSQLDSLNYVFFGGEPLKAEKMKAWKQYSDCQLINTYGPTECTDIATYHHLQDLDNYAHRAIPIGKPNANVKLYILDNELNLLPAGMTGEICIGGASVGLGYVTQPELTGEKFLPDPYSDEAGDILYKTGDLGRYQDDDGNIEHMGRIDFQLKLRGLRIELGEIEYALQQQNAVSEVLVMEYHEQLLAYLTLDTDIAQAIDTVQLKKELAHFLPQYMIPQHFVQLDTFPLTEHGKIDRQSLPEPELQSVVAYCAPQTDIEQSLAAIWSEVLDVAKIGIHDSFFDLGGHSLIAVKLIARIETEFDSRLPIVKLMQTPTIAEIAQFLEQDNTRQSQLVTLQADGDKTPVFCIHGVGGNIHTFAALAREMGDNRPFYAIQSSGLLSDAEIQTSIADMTLSYVREIEKQYAQGPLILAGHSMGGVIAFEIASYFKQQGRTVEQLILLDSPSPRIIHEELRNQGFDWLDANTREQLQAYMELTFDEAFEQLSFDDKLDYMLAEIKQQISEDDNVINRTIAVHIANFMAINRFVTDSLYDGDILLLKAQSNEGHSRYWEDFTSARLIARDVQGDHHTMLDSPHVEQLADLISENVRH